MILFFLIRMFEEYMHMYQQGITDEELRLAKENHFAYWCRDYVSMNFILLKF